MKVLLVVVDVVGSDSYWGAERGGTIGALETDTIVSQSVQVGRLDKAVAVAAKRVCPLLVC